MSKRSGFEQTENVINEVYDAVKIPFFVMYIVLVAVSSTMVVIAVFKGWIALPWPMIFLTPMSLLIIGVSLRKIKYNWFYDLPGIVMPSLGLGMIGLMAVIG